MKVKLKGVNKLQKKLQQNMNLEPVKQVVATHGPQLQQKAMRNAEGFRGHMRGNDFVRPTGDLRRSIGLELGSEGLSATVGPTAHYGAYVEFGTRFMDAQPYLRPALDVQARQFIRDLKLLMR